MNDQLPQLPSSSYVERVVASLEKHPLGSVLLIIFTGIVVFGIYVWKH